MTDTPTPPPAARDAIEAACCAYNAAALTNRTAGMADGAGMRSAIAAYHAALPGEFSALKNVLAAAAHAYDGEMIGEMSESALAAITALEARLAAAYDRCSRQADDIAAEWPDAPSGRHGWQDGAMEVAAAISALAAKE